MIMFAQELDEHVLLKVNEAIVCIRQLSSLVHVSRKT
jgi:hypothetical protein